MLRLTSRMQATANSSRLIRNVETVEKVLFDGQND